MTFFSCVQASSASSDNTTAAAIRAVRSAAAVALSVAGEEDLRSGPSVAMAPDSARPIIRRSVRP